MRDWMIRLALSDLYSLASNWSIIVWQDKCKAFNPNIAEEVKTKYY